jgi:membrane protease YdiL (CAAX protease family)
MPIRSWADGNMTLQNMLVYSLGYIILSGTIALMWGMLFEMTGLIWFSLADHFFNNTIINVLHIKTDSGIDELQIARSLIAQLIALALVSLLYIRKRRGQIKGVQE